jgi:invasion protein IalB
MNDGACQRRSRDQEDTMAITIALACSLVAAGLTLLMARLAARCEQQDHRVAVRRSPQGWRGACSRQAFGDDRCDLG